MVVGKLRKILIHNGPQVCSNNHTSRSSLYSVPSGRIWLQWIRSPYGEGGDGRLEEAWIDHTTTNLVTEQAQPSHAHWPRLANY